MKLDPRIYAQLQNLYKYPRTPHLESSRLQLGDTDNDQARYQSLAGKYIVVEEKVDGANAGISFSSAGDLLLQSRGHYLVGGSRERQFSMLKLWAKVHERWLLDRLEDRYVMFGEVMSKVHSVYYDALPHIFLEFDILDRKRGVFLSTQARRTMLKGGPVLSAPVLYEGIAPQSLAGLLKLVGHSKARTSNWRESFVAAVLREGLDLQMAWKNLDESDLMEGLYLKIESAGETAGRLKWVRHDFVQSIQDAGVHHLQQPYIPNRLADGVDLYSPQLAVTWEAINKGDR